MAAKCGSSVVIVIFSRICIDRPYPLRNITVFFCTPYMEVELPHRQHCSSLFAKHASVWSYISMLYLPCFYTFLSTSSLLAKYRWKRYLLSCIITKHSRNETPLKSLKENKIPLSGDWSFLPTSRRRQPRYTLFSEVSACSEYMSQSFFTTESYSRWVISRYLHNTVRTATRTAQTLFGCISGMSRENFRRSPFVLLEK